MKQRTANILTAALLALLALCWVVYLCFDPPVDLWGRLLGLALCALLGWGVYRFVPDLLSFWRGEPDAPFAGEQLGERSLRFFRRHPVWQLCLLLLAVRVVLLVAGHVFLLLREGYHGGMAQQMDLWLQGAAVDNLSLTQGGYAAFLEGQTLPLPLYPALTLLFGQLTGDALWGGLLVSTLCAVGAGYALYELVLLDEDRKTALRAAKFTLIFPAAFLLGAPLCWSLFLLLSILCLYGIRRGRYPVGCLLGGLAALASPYALLLLVPAAVEYVSWLRRKDTEARLQTLENGAPDPMPHPVVRGLCLGLIVLPLIVFLLLFPQAAHGLWGQFLQQWTGLQGFFFHQGGMCLQGLLKSADPALIWGRYVPGLLTAGASLALLLTGQKGIRPSYTAYLIAALGAGLLCSPGGVAALFPVYLLLARSLRRRWLNGLLGAVCLLALVLYVYGFSLGYALY